MTKAQLDALKAANRKLRKLAFGLPEAYEDHPWGESVAKVKKKVFVFFGHNDKEALKEGLGFSVKLPESRWAALDLPFTTPTGYGLGKSGWVSVKFPPGRKKPPTDIFEQWIIESYCAVAPKKLIKILEQREQR